MIFIFLDGVGIGENNDNNPFKEADPQILRFWRGGSNRIAECVMKEIDPLLGVEGIPQSATGQTTMFTGINVPQIRGSHYGSFPDKMMRKIIKEENLLKKLRDLSVKAKYINSFPMHSVLFSNSNVRILDDGTLKFSDNFPRQFKRRISVTTSMIISNGTIPPDVDEMLQKRSLYQDFSNKSLIKRGLEIDEFSPLNAAGIIQNASAEQDFILYEFFQTDYYGHRKNFNDKVALIREVDQLIRHLLELLNPLIDTLLLTSDHGNLEDSRTKSHTKNMVPLLTWGHNADILSEKINSLEDITPVIVELLKKDPVKIGSNLSV